MDALLQEITSLPGILGCFVYSGERKIVSSTMPPIFKKNNISTIANLLARTVQIGRMAELSIEEIEIKYHESLLMVRPFSKKALLVLICEPGANKALISMTLGILTEDLEDSIVQARQAQLTPTPPPSTRQQPTAAHVAPQKRTHIDSQLASILEQITDALAMAIGPIARPVMKDSVDIWARQQTPSTASLAALIKLLCVEIDNQDWEQEFLEEIKKISLFRYLGK